MYGYVYIKEDGNSEQPLPLPWHMGFSSWDPHTHPVQQGAGGRYTGCCLVAGDAGSHIGAAQASFHQGNWSLHRVSRALEGGLAMGDRPEEQGFRTWRVRGQSDSPSLARLAQKDSDLNPCKIFWSSVSCLHYRGPQMSPSTPAVPLQVVFKPLSKVPLGWFICSFHGHVIIWTQVLNFPNSNYSCSAHWLVSSSGNIFEHPSQKWVRS